MWTIPGLNPSGRPSVWISGAGTGIGRALAARLLRDGFRVAVSGRRAEVLQALRDEQPPDRREDVRVLPCDVTRPEDVRSRYGELRSAWGVPDMVVANAGTHANLTASEITYEACRTIVEVNLMGAVAFITAVLPDFLERGSGVIVGVSSVAGYRGLPRAAAYSASKAGLTAFLQGLRFEVEPRGVRVVVVSPGFVRTPLTDRNPFPMPFLIGAEEAADLIVRGLRSGRFEIHFPWPFTWTCKLLRILPYGLYHAWIRRATRPRRKP